MATLKQFDFKSINKIDGEINEINFVCKGYIDDKVIYFRNDNDTYKFILEDTLTVHVNNSVYKFDINKKTLAHISNGEFTMQASIETNNIEITDNKILIEYILDFNTFKGEYKIILSYH